MPSATAKATLDREFLEMRSRILELAAAMDRIQRAGDPASEARWQQLHEAIQLLTESQRAEKVQHLFSRPFESDWRTKLDV